MLKKFQYISNHVKVIKLYITVSPDKSKDTKGTFINRADLMNKKITWWHLQIKGTQIIRRHLHYILVLKIFLHIFNYCEIIESVASDMSCNNSAIRKKTPIFHSVMFLRNAQNIEHFLVNTPIIYHRKCIMSD